MCARPEAIHNDRDDGNGNTSSNQTVFYDPGSGFIAQKCL